LLFENNKLLLQLNHIVP